MEVPNPRKPPPIRHSPTPHFPNPSPKTRPPHAPPSRIFPNSRRLLCLLRQTNHENPRPCLRQLPLLRHPEPPPLQLQGSEKMEATEASVEAASRRWWHPDGGGIPAAVGSEGGGGCGEGGEEKEEGGKDKIWFGSWVGVWIWVGFRLVKWSVLG
ncbi:hypothetical protein LINPERPRIM_LOCUS6903 [Linum perenne]